MKYNSLSWLEFDLFFLHFSFYYYTYLILVGPYLSYISLTKINKLMLYLIVKRVTDFQ